MVADASALLAGVQAYIAEAGLEPDRAERGWLSLGDATRRYPVRPDTLRSWLRRDPALGRKRTGSTG